MARDSYAYVYTYCTYVSLINVREHKSSDQEWAIQRHCQHWAYKTFDEDKIPKQTNKQTKNTNTQHKTPQMMSYTDPPETEVISGAIEG